VEPYYKNSALPNKVFFSNVPCSFDFSPPLIVFSSVTFFFEAKSLGFPPRPSRTARNTKPLTFFPPEEQKSFVAHSIFLLHPCFLLSILPPQACCQTFEAPSRGGAEALIQGCLERVDLLIEGSDHLSTFLFFPFLLSRVTLCGLARSHTQNTSLIAHPRPPQTRQVKIPPLWISPPSGRSGLFFLS